jgi:hypothetical protein
LENYVTVKEIKMKKEENIDEYFKTILKACRSFNTFKKNWDKINAFSNDNFDGSDEERIRNHPKYGKVSAKVSEMNSSLREMLE